MTDSIARIHFLLTYLYSLSFHNHQNILSVFLFVDFYWSKAKYTRNFGVCWTEMSRQERNERTWRINLMSSLWSRLCWLWLAKQQRTEEYVSTTSIQIIISQTKSNIFCAKSKKIKNKMVYILELYVLLALVSIGQYTSNNNRIVFFFS